MIQHFVLLKKENLKNKKKGTFLHKYLGIPADNDGSTLMLHIMQFSVMQIK